MSSATSHFGQTGIITADDAGSVKAGQAGMTFTSGPVQSNRAGMLTSVAQIDWATWRPTEYANLCFVIRDGQILLIRKKRGLGAGKMNGPGGRNEPGETAMQAAVRETQEEIGVTPTGLEQVGELHFHFLDGYRLHVAVFAASDCIGELIETDEAIPQWTRLDSIPYHEMWQDDPHWLPLLLRRKKFSGFFLFDGDQLLSHQVNV